MFEEEEIPPKRREIGVDLSPLSVDDLHQYIADLEAEIARVRVDIEAKQKHLSGAEALFRR